MGRSSKSSKKPSKKAVPVMNQSGQTDAERRDLRRAQRLLRSEITQSEMGDAMEDPTSDAFEKVRKKNNDLFDQVRHTREGVLDGENLDLISSRAAKQMEKLVQVPRYDAAKFARKLQEKCHPTAPRGRFDWSLLGREVGTCFNAVPRGVSFLCGPIDSAYAPKERKKSTRRRKSDADEEENVKEAKPEVVKQMEKDADKLSAVEKHMKVISKTLHSRCKREGAKQLSHLEETLADRDESEWTSEQRKKKRRLTKTGQAEISAIHCLFNPKSFTQTVENLFHFSFLVKHGQASIRVDRGSGEDDPGEGPVVCPATTNEANVPARQAIVAFTMKDWRNLVEAYGVEDSFVPHRTGSRFGSKKKTVRKG